MKIFPDTTVYILCVPAIETGGPTAIHQLASQMTALGIRTKIFYVEIAGYDFEFPVADSYRKYHLDWTREIDDDPHNILVVYEGMPQGIYSLPKIRKVFWWLSVDNYIASLRGQINRIDCNNLARIPLERFFYFGQSIKITHWCQSEYARQFLQCNGVPQEDVFMVEDYLSWEFLAGGIQPDLAAKENIVAYNPSKGKEVTEKLIAQRPDIDWRPIENMTPAEVRELLLRAKVYIDFGHHPGKDRIPREAAMSGCVVITGRRGAAANYVDINIPADFKMADEDSAGILQKIEAVFAEFNQAYQHQEVYRQRIWGDYPRFVQEITAALEIDAGQVPVWSAVLNDDAGQGVDIARALWELNEEYALEFIVDNWLAKVARPSELIHEEKGRRYLRLNDQASVEILSTEDASFLYREGRIKKFFAKDTGQDKGYFWQLLPDMRREDLLLL